MNNLIDRFPKRWMKPLGLPMKERLNAIYDGVLIVSEMYIARDPPEHRFKQCQKVIDELVDLQEWIYLYWNISDLQNGIKQANDNRRAFMTDSMNHELFLLVRVMEKLNRNGRFGEIRAQYMKKFSKRQIEKAEFLKKLYELNGLVYHKSIRIPLSQQDEEITLARKYIRNAFYCAYSANFIPTTKSEYKTRRKLFSEAISDLYRLNRPMLKLFMIHLFSDEDVELITNLINDSTKILQSIQKSDKERFFDLC